MAVYLVLEVLAAVAVVEMAEHGGQVGQLQLDEQAPLVLLFGDALVCPLNSFGRTMDFSSS